MTEEEKEHAAPEGADTQQPGTGTTFLPASFFSKLVRQPSCITKGLCDNCGRCEH